jgi:hypothetical protein
MNSNVSSDIDFNINNYTFNDILKLFKLTHDYDENQLLKAKKMVIQTHPENSNIDRKYYDLFLQAYKIIKTSFDEKKKQPTANHVKNNLFKVIENNTEEEASLIDIPTNIINTCYNPSNYSTQLVSIHTEDRDVKKYPFQNNFEVELPQVFKNVLSLELYDITLPTYYYNISEVLQNTSLWFSIPYFFNEPIELKMDSGFYNNTNFVELFIKKLNETTTNELYALGVYASPTTQYTDFDAVLDPVSNKLITYNKSNEFQFWCQNKSEYNDCSNDNWKMLIEWGLPYNMGFDKHLYTSIYDTTLNSFVLVSPNQFSISINNTIYMEIDNFNYINEITPFSKSTTSYHNNDYSGIVNSAFAKLILSNVTNTYIPVAKFKRTLPHIEEKIGKLKFRFRYHNGNLVDFLKQDFNFSLKMICRFDCKY